MARPKARSISRLLGNFVGAERMSQEEMRGRFLNKMMQEELEISRDALGPVPAQLEWHSIHKDEHDRWILLQMPKRADGKPWSPKDPDAMPAMRTFIHTKDGLGMLPHNMPPGQYVPTKTLEVEPRLSAYVLKGIKRYASAAAEMHRSKM